MMNGRKPTRAHLPFIIHHSSFCIYGNVIRLIAAKRQVIPAKAELNRIAHRSPADDLDLGSVAKAHLQQPTANVVIARDRNHLPLTAHTQFAQWTGI
jgi:hypothetical protein